MEANASLEKDNTFSECDSQHVASSHYGGFNAVLDSLRMDALHTAECHLASPWAFKVNASTRLMYCYYVQQGALYLNVHGQEISLREGEFALLPQGDEHCISDGHATEYRVLDTITDNNGESTSSTIAFAEGGSQTILHRGEIAYSLPQVRRLSLFLPRTIAVCKEGIKSQRILDFLFQIISPGIQAIAQVKNKILMCRLADMIFITVLSHHIETGNRRSSQLLSIMDDNRICKSLEQIHLNPDRNWSLLELAKQAGMSRTNFINRFKSLVGTTPIDYLVSWKMSLAYNKLQFENTSTLNVALELGYQSESAFSRAFKKNFGKSPGEVRQKNRAAMLHKE